MMMITEEHTHRRYTRGVGESERAAKMAGDEREM